MSRMSVDRRAGPKAGEEALRRAYTVCFFFLFFSFLFFLFFPFFSPSLFFSFPLFLFCSFALKDANIVIQKYLYFPCGVIRGALQGLGLDVTVTAETTEIPSATFQIKTKGAKP